MNVKRVLRSRAVRILGRALIAVIIGYGLMFAVLLAASHP